MTNMEAVDAAEAAGFVAAAGVTRNALLRHARLAQAYEHYRYVTEDQIQAFQMKLAYATPRRVLGDTHLEYDTLALEPIDEYAGLPPADVVAKVRAAKDSGVFDMMEVARIVTQRVVNDPIVFGRIVGCTDRFVIAQWGSDIQVADLIQEGQG